MILKYYHIMIEYLRANAILIGFLMAIVEPLKIWLKKWKFYQTWQTYVMVGILSLLLAIPETGFVGIDVFNYITHAIGLFLIATGLYKVFFDKPPV